VTKSEAREVLEFLIASSVSDAEMRVVIDAFELAVASEAVGPAMKAYNDGHSAAKMAALLRQVRDGK